MAFDTFTAFAGVYPDLESAEADYELVKELHTKQGFMDAYDAAVIHRREDGKVKITQEARDPDPRRWRARGRGGPGHRARRGPLPVRRGRRGPPGGHLGGRGDLGAVAGHAAAGMSREDLKEIGESLDNGEAGLVVVGVTDMEARIEESMRRAEKV